MNSEEWQQLNEHLSQMPKELRVAFAAKQAARALPSLVLRRGLDQVYFWYWRDSQRAKFLKAVCHAVDCAWQCAREGYGLYPADCPTAAHAAVQAAASDAQRAAYFAKFYSTRGTHAAACDAGYAATQAAYAAAYAADQATAAGTDSVARDAARAASDAAKHATAAYAAGEAGTRAWEVDFYELIEDLRAADLEYLLTATSSCDLAPKEQATVLLAQPLWGSRWHLAEPFVRAFVTSVRELGEEVISWADWYMGLCHGSATQVPEDIAAQGSTAIIAYALGRQDALKTKSGESRLPTGSPPRRAARNAQKERHGR